jgi:predicted RNA-binding protein with PUA-like domain
VKHGGRQVRAEAEALPPVVGAEEASSGAQDERRALFCNSRLGVQPVTDQEFEFILSLETIQNA